MIEMQQTNQHSAGFANVVDRILNNNNFEIAIQTVKTTDQTSYGQNTTLRLKNVNSDFSDNFKDVITNGSKPVVMSGGIFSNLFAWEGNNKDGLAWDLVNDGHDVWEIEMNGYKNTECTDCPDYTYQDQVDYFWPALVAGVMNYSGKNQVNYVGHSNGCRVALSSLNSYSSGKDSAGWAYNSVTGLYDLNISLPNLPVDKFFGVACPATLNDETLFTNLVRYDGNSQNRPAGNLAMSDINQSNLKHVKLEDYAKPLVTYAPTLGVTELTKFFSGLAENKLSRNIMQFYNDLALSNSNSFDVSSVDMNELYLFNGKIVTSDLIVGFNDQQRILDSATISTEEGFKYLGLIDSNHISIKSNSQLKEDIRGKLK